MITILRRSAIPLRDRVLVRQVAATDTIGGLVVPDVARDRPSEGIVLAVGQGRTLDNGVSIEMIVKVGDRVVFGRYGGADIKVGEEELKVLREDEIMVLLVDEEVEVDEDDEYENESDREMEP